MKNLSVLLCLALLCSVAGCSEKPRDEIVISIPHNSLIRNVNSNYYKEWLEEQTGLSIRFNVIYEELTAEYLRSSLESGHVKSDAVFSPFVGGEVTDFNGFLQEIGEYILPLNRYIEDSVYLKAIFEDDSEYGLRAAMTAADGNIYYMPGFDPSAAKTNYQVLWLNQKWLKALKLRIPQTPEELRDVLYAFKTQDPNGNGIQDEIPLAGSYEVRNEHCYNAILNAYVYNDPDNSRLFVEDGQVRFAPVTDQWREAMRYLNGLYADGLISGFAMTHAGLEGLANDPWEALGGFASQSVTDVIFPSNRDVANHFVHAPPLAGADGTRRATVKTPAPVPAGIIMAGCKNPEAVFRLFDLMLSEEAFLIGRYGEENVDWTRGRDIDLDFYGNNATVKVINQLWDGVQNKHLRETGPFYAYPKYADGVTFTAFDMDQEYMDARAYRVYEQYRPEEYIRTLGRDGELQTLRQSIDAYTEQSVKAFITGELDPSDDAVWAAHLETYKELGADALIRAAQSAYTAK